MLALYFSFNISDSAMAAISLWPPMTGLTIFGLFAVTAMLVCYALEARSRWFILAFAGACALGSVYGFHQGAWPFGIVEAVCSLVAVRRWVGAGR
jgi:hypothetical protein